MKVSTILIIILGISGLITVAGFVNYNSPSNQLPQTPIQPLYMNEEGNSSIIIDNSTANIQLSNTYCKNPNGIEDLNIGYRNWTCLNRSQMASILIYYNMTYNLTRIKYTSYLGEDYAYSGSVTDYTNRYSWCEGYDWCNKPFKFYGYDVLPYIKEMQYSSSGWFFGIELAKNPAKFIRLEKDVLEPNIKNVTQNITFVSPTPDYREWYYSVTGHYP